jgi:universal stress protein A
VQPLRTILFATDFSETAACAFDMACALARDYSAKLVILHAAVPPPVVLPDGVVVDFDDAEYVRGLEKQLHAVRPTDSTIRFEHRLEQGDAATEILRVARETQADWIVMGTHGRTGLLRLLMGSVAEQVLRGAPCPVLAVRMPSPKLEARENALPKRKTTSHRTVQ